ncbi:MAG: hypothetical protein H6657_14475 [Ardenticatenaceae bacterium]|nr:hypothetical protein [Ardenticatenaceae bacterium]
MEAKRKAKAIKGMLYLMNRIQALEQLSQWASSKYYSRRGKKFLHIRLSYEKQREILDSKLSLLRFRYPRLYWVARILYYVSNLVTVNPVYSPGSAASYRRRVTS